MIDQLAGVPIPASAVEPLVFGQRVRDYQPAMLDELLDPLARCLDTESARRLAEFRVGPAVQRRVDALAERANEGLLTDDERGEYEYESFPRRESQAKPPAPPIE